MTAFLVEALPARPASVAASWRRNVSTYAGDENKEWMYRCCLALAENMIQATAWLATPAAATGLHADANHKGVVHCLVKRWGWMTLNQRRRNSCAGTSQMPLNRSWRAGQASEQVRAPASPGAWLSHEGLCSPSATSETCATAAETPCALGTSGSSPDERSSGI